MLHNDYDQPSCQLLTQEAYQKAYELLLEGIKEETLDSKTKEDLKQAAWKIYTTLSKEAQNFVEEHKQIIQKIAELLEEKTTISLKEIDEIYL